MQDDFDIPKLPQDTNKMKLNKNILALIGIGVLILIVLGFFGFQYIAPFGAKVIYQFTSDKNRDRASGLLGADKSGTIETNAVNSLIIPQQIIRNNIVTFNLKLLSKKIDGIWVNFKFKGDPKEIKIGVRGSEKESYLYQPLYNQILNSLSWSQTTENKTTFWQREKKYKDLSELISKPPISDLPKVASYFYNPSDVVMKKNSSSLQSNLKIEKTLRGTHTLLVKVDKEPLLLTVTKQDFNSYKGEDILSVKIYKEEKKILEKDIPDDGITDTSNIRLQPQKITIRIDKPELGVYKIVLIDKSFGSDVRITKIETNQTKIVFIPPLFIIDEKPTEIFTNSNYITMETIHAQSTQTVKIDNEQKLNIEKENKEYRFNFEDSSSNKENNAIVSSNIKSHSNIIHKIKIPKNDLVIKGNGFFVFNKDAFFNPEPIETTDLSQITELDNIDYIIGNYRKVKKDGDWNIAQVYFDPKDIKIDGDRLYFSLESPGLQTYNGQITLDTLEVTVDKPGWFDSAKQNSINNKPFGQTQSKQDKGFFGNIWNGTTGFFGGVWNSTTKFFTGLWPFKSAISHQPSAISKSPKVPTNTPTPTPTLKENLKITIQNGGEIEGAAGKYADLLKTAGFKNVDTGNAPNSGFKNAAISYNKDEEENLGETIDKIKQILSKDYEIIDTDTKADKGKIIIILGQIPKPTPTATSSAR